MKFYFVLFSAIHARAERGAGMAEYVLLLALVAAAMVAAFGTLVTAMTNQLSNTSGVVTAN